MTGNNYNLTLTNSGAATLGGAISGVNVLTANGGGTLQVNAAIAASSLSDSEATTFNVTGSPAVTTTGDQSYSGAVTLGQDTGLTAATHRTGGRDGREQEPDADQQRRWRRWAGRSAG